MQIRLKPTGTDPRIFDVTIDFTGYQDLDCIYFRKWGGVLMRRDLEVSEEKLDKLLTTLKLNRISCWRPAYEQWRYGNRIRINKYTTTVISDRGLEG